MVSRMVWQLMEVVPNNKNPLQALNSLFNEIKITPKQIQLKAIANNVFHDLKETFNVFLFTVEVEEKPDIKEVPEGDEIIWLSKEEILNHDKVLTEYKKIYPKVKENKILFYHTEYDFDKMLNMEFYK